MRHVDIPTTSEIKGFLEARADACVSIYLPTHVLTQMTDIDRLEFRSLSETALKQLNEVKLGRGRVAALGDRLGKLGADDAFWRVQANSLAVLATPDGITTYRLPSHLRAAVEVSDRYHLRPLLRSISFPGAAYVLAFSQNASRLIEVTPDGPATEITVPDMPAGLEDVVAGSDHREPASPSRSDGEGRKVLIGKYAREIDAALRPILAGGTVPLILACVDFLGPLYRAVNTYPHLAEETVTGNAKYLSAGELATEARSILQRLNAAKVASLRARYEDLFGSGRSTSDLAQIVRAACSGAVQTLIFDIDGSSPGHVDDGTGAFRMSDGSDATNYDVVDEVVGQVILHGGEVVGVRKDDLPDRSFSVAALLRYLV